MATSERNTGTGVFRRKPIGEPEPTAGREDRGLTRSLGLWQLTAIGIGGIIGAGIFALAGAVANEKAGPAVLVSFLIAGVASAGRGAGVRGVRRDGAGRRLGVHPRHAGVRVLQLPAVGARTA